METFLMLAICIAALVLLWFVAKCFYEAAKEKGYHSKKYLWLCFWLGLPGWLLVCALPDRGNCVQVNSNECPDSSVYNKLDKPTIKDNKAHSNSVTTIDKKTEEEMKNQHKNMSPEELEFRLEQLGKKLDSYK